MAGETWDKPILDRQHKYAAGDLVAHCDSPGDPIRVVELTLRVVWDAQGVARAYPTYTLEGRGMLSAAEQVDDVLCTRDLVPYRDRA